MTFSYWTACVAGPAIMHKLFLPRHQYICASNSTSFQASSIKYMYFLIKYYLMLVRSALRDSPRAVSATRPHPSCHKSRKAQTHQHYMVYCCSVVDIKLCADFRRCLPMVSADIAWSIRRIQHALDYAIYGQGGAFDVAHEVTINVYNL